MIRSKIYLWNFEYYWFWGSLKGFLDIFAFNHYQITQQKHWKFWISRHISVQNKKILFNFSCGQAVNYVCNQLFPLFGHRLDQIEIVGKIINGKMLSDFSFVGIADEKEIGDNLLAPLLTLSFVLRTNSVELSIFVDEWYNFSLPINAIFNWLHFAESAKRIQMNSRRHSSVAGSKRSLKIAVKLQSFALTNTIVASTEELIERINRASL